VVAEDGFALSGFPEFVRSGEDLGGDASWELKAGELTDPVVAGVAAAPRRVASWALVTQTGRVSGAGASYRVSWLPTHDTASALTHSEDTGNSHRAD
jgi:hypothetical protein